MPAAADPTASDARTPRSSKSPTRSEAAPRTGSAASSIPSSSVARAAPTQRLWIAASPPRRSPAPAARSRASGGKDADGRHQAAIGGDSGGQGHSARAGDLRRWRRRQSGLTHPLAEGVGCIALADSAAALLKLAAGASARITAEMLHQRQNCVRDARLRQLGAARAPGPDLGRVSPPPRASRSSASKRARRRVSFRLSARRPPLPPRFDLRAAGLARDEPPSTPDGRGLCAAKRSIANSKLTPSPASCSASWAAAGRARSAVYLRYPAIDLRIPGRFGVPDEQKLGSSTGHLHESPPGVHPSFGLWNHPSGTIRSGFR